MAPENRRVNPMQDQETSGQLDAKQSRRPFLRRLGRTAAIGSGLPLLLAKPAWAVDVRCCRDSSCGLNCPGPARKYRCGPPASCCICSTSGRQCFNAPCCPC